MENSNDSSRSPDEEEGITIAGRHVPYQSGVLPKDFAKRLIRLQEASGLTWNAFADALGVDKKQLYKWRKKGHRALRRGYARPHEARPHDSGMRRHPHGRGLPDVPLAGPAGLNHMPRQRTHHRSEAYYVSPDDFGECLVRFKGASGLSWAEIARRLGTSPLTVRR